MNIGAPKLVILLNPVERQPWYNFLEPPYCHFELILVEWMYMPKVITNKIIIVREYVSPIPIIRGGKESKT